MDEDPTKKQAASVKNKVNELTRLKLISPANSKLLTLNDPRIARAYVRPKIHKVDAPLRIIVPHIGSPTYNLTKWGLDHALAETLPTLRKGSEVSDADAVPRQTSIFRLQYRLLHQSLRNLRTAAVGVRYSILETLDGEGHKHPRNENPRSNRPERRTALVARELARYKVDIAALSETRFSEQGQLEEVDAGYTFFWSGRPNAKRRDAGITFALRHDIVGRLPCLP
ncbi:unnamed protein product [Schistocephalus solidus]|uniref:Uncharacterized protein n=1 Tax=Schistocephalus solidus TaxID=70667 RepID=A0A183TJT6_SCHSO|nr:unnamed protein product [Schistocephalus solidus]